MELPVEVIEAEYDEENMDPDFANDVDSELEENDIEEDEIDKLNMVSKAISSTPKSTPKSMSTIATVVDALGKLETAHWAGKEKSCTLITLLES